MNWTVVICTRDRAGLLAETLASLRGLADPGVLYDVVVVDNGSRDRTRAAVEAAAAASPVPLRYVYEPRGGLSAARNAGIRAASGGAIAFTDDDVLVDPGWLAAFARALRDRPVDFLGGRVLPRWGAPRPPWLPAGRTRGEIWGAVALFDYGEEARPLAKPLGANMAFLRAALEAAGGFREDLGRDAASLKGQEVPELLQRLAAAGGRGGWYVPDAVVHHWIPPERLTKRYFRRWFYWKGVSRAAIGDRVHVAGEWLPAGRVRRLVGLPRSLYKETLLAAGRLVARAAAGDSAGAFDAEIRLWYAAGYARAIWLGDPSPTGKAKSAAASPSFPATGRAPDAPLSSTGNKLLPHSADGEPGSPGAGPTGHGPREAPLRGAAAESAHAPRAAPDREGKPDTRGRGAEASGQAAPRGESAPAAVPEGEGARAR